MIESTQTQDSDAAICEIETNDSELEDVMANPEHLEILKQGVTAWNKWREENSAVRPDLREATLGEADLRGADLREATLSGANLSGADLRGANLIRVILTGANLNRAILTQAKLYGANLNGADLNGADLREATLSGATLSGATLSGATLNSAVVGGTVFGNLDLSTVKGLEDVIHTSPSIVGIDTIYRSKGNIPEIFLRGCGVPDNFIAYMHSLAGHAKAFEFYSAFISYSSKDQAFAERLHADLQAKGVRVWFAPEDLKIGDTFRTRIDEASRLYDKLMVVLSDHSMQSEWVEKEVEAAFEKERNEKRTVLFPIRLDDAVMQTDQAWATDIRRTRDIGDFSNWKDYDRYQQVLAGLLLDLKAEPE